MKKLIILLIIPLFSFFYQCKEGNLGSQNFKSDGFYQSDLERVQYKTEIQGSIINTFRKDGSLSMECSYPYPSSYIKYFDETGRLSKKYIFIGGDERKEILYKENGRIDIINIKKNKIKHGQSIHFCDDDSEYNVKYKIDYLNGKKDGFYIVNACMNNPKKNLFKGSPVVVKLYKKGKLIKKIKSFPASSKSLSNRARISKILDADISTLNEEDKRVRDRLINEGYDTLNKRVYSNLILRSAWVAEADEADRRNYTGIYEDVEWDLHFMTYDENLNIIGNMYDVSNYDLRQMVNFFLDNCKNYGIIIPKQNIKVTFEELEGSTIALAFGKDNDNEIIIKVDPKNWENASLFKKWYILYHELGHDVLNLSHGEGGKMMFNFAERNYSWDEFIIDRNEMFHSYLKYY